MLTVITGSFAFAIGGSFQSIRFFKRASLSCAVALRKRMTNFALILNDLTASFEGRNEYIARLCRAPLLILDDFGMERGTEYGLEQVYNVVDSRRCSPPVPAGLR